MSDNDFFPAEFDHEFYALQWPDAGKMSRQEAHAHFLRFGKTCGLAGSPLSDMHFFVRFLKRLHFRHILEIGPGPKPRMLGENVRYFDVSHRERLLQRADAQGIDRAEVPVIHYRSDDGSLASIDRKFDLVFSSHCIEHVYDTVRHLNEVADLLEDGGRYALIVPDKRYTFDHFRPPNSLGDVVAQNFHQVNNHTLQTLVDSMFTTHNDPSRHWNDDHGELPLVGPDKLEKAVTRYQTQRTHGHAWIFTDDSFRDIYTQLTDMEVTRLKVTRVYNTIRNSNSFCVVMKKTAEQ